MKFTEALREADARGLPDYRGAFINRDTRKWVGEKPPTCAIGGAAVVSGSFRFEEGIAHGFLSTNAVHSAQAADQCSDWRVITDGFVQLRCPRCGHWAQAYQSIVHLYDGHKWSRTKIADWLDGELAEVAR